MVVHGTVNQTDGVTFREPLGHLAHDLEGLPRVQRAAPIEERAQVLTRDGIGRQEVQAQVGTADLAQAVDRLRAQTCARFEESVEPFPEVARSRVSRMEDLEGGGAAGVGVVARAEDPAVGAFAEGAADLEAAGDAMPGCGRYGIARRSGGR